MNYGFQMTTLKMICHACFSLYQRKLKYVQCRISLFAVVSSALNKIHGNFCFPFEKLEDPGISVGGIKI